LTSYLNGLEDNVELHVGDAVEARFRGTGKWYVGKVERINQDGSYDVIYYDGDRDKGLDRRHIRIGQVLRLNIGYKRLQSSALSRVAREAKRSEHHADLVVIETLAEDKFELGMELELANSKGEKAKFRLDAMNVADCNFKVHISALITCGGKEYGFDGESYKHMEPFDWKREAIEKKKTWTYEGAVWRGKNPLVGTKVEYNLDKSYSQAFYYRI